MSAHDHLALWLGSTEQLHETSSCMYMHTLSHNPRPSSNSNAVQVQWLHESIRHLDRMKGSYNALLYIQAECISTVTRVVGITMGQAGKPTIGPEAPWQCMDIHWKQVWSSIDSDPRLHRVKTHMVCWIICFYVHLCSWVATYHWLCLLRHLFWFAAKAQEMALLYLQFIHVHLVSLSSSLVCWASLRWASPPMMDVQ